MSLEGRAQPVPYPSITASYNIHNPYYLGGTQLGNLKTNVISTTAEGTNYLQRIVITTNLFPVYMDGKVH